MGSVGWQWYLCKKARNYLIKRDYMKEPKKMKKEIRLIGIYMKNDCTRPEPFMHYICYAYLSIIIAHYVDSNNCVHHRGQIY